MGSLGWGQIVLDLLGHRMGLGIQTNEEPLEDFHQETDMI